MLDLQAALMGNPPKATRREAIRALNDAFRKSFVGGSVMITDGVAAMPADERAELMAAVRPRPRG
jgi:hypothetical protein